MSSTPDNIAALLEELAGARTAESAIRTTVPGLRRLLGFDWLAVWPPPGAGPSVAAFSDGSGPPSPPPDAVPFGPRDRPRGLLAGAGPEGSLPAAARILSAAVERAEAFDRLVRERDSSRAETGRRRRAEESKDRFLSAVSHEFRTPLTSIRSFAEILMSHSPEDDATRKEFISIIHDESVRLSRMVNNLLDLSKMQAGRMAWDFRENDLAETVARAARNVASLLSERQIECAITTEGDLAPFAFDRDKILQVVVNLLANAAKYSPAGERIEIHVAAGRDSACVRVRDHGPGIAEEDRGRVFERFTQVGAAHPELPGTGLGLSISREIVLAHHGRIWADAAPAGGSEFCFELPRRPSGDAGRTAEPPEEPVGGAAVPDADGAGALILVTDDDPNFRRFLQYELSQAGYRIVEAATGCEAVRLARQETPDLLLLDLMLPDLTGEDVLALLAAREETRRIPVCVVSVEPEARGGNLLPPSRVLRKPVNGPELLGRIRAALGPS